MRLENDLANAISFPERERAAYYRFGKVPFSIRSCRALSNPAQAAAAKPPPVLTRLTPASARPATCISGPSNKAFTGFGATALLAIGAVSLLACAGGGLYWWPAAVVLAYLGALTNAWVLIVEILR